VQNSNKSMDFTLNFDSMEAMEKFDISQIMPEMSSCTVCVKLEIVGNGGSMCATAATCKEAIQMIKDAIK